MDVVHVFMQQTVRQFEVVSGTQQHQIVECIKPSIVTVSSIGKFCINPYVKTPGLHMQVGRMDVFHATYNSRLAFATYVEPPALSWAHSHALYAYLWQTSAACADQSHCPDFSFTKKASMHHSSFEYEVKYSA
jgi:hypothetical protein